MEPAKESRGVAYLFYFTVRLNAGKPEEVLSKYHLLSLLSHADQNEWIRRDFTSSMISCCHASHRVQAHCSGFHLLGGDSRRWRRAENNSEKHWNIILRKIGKGRQEISFNQVLCDDSCSP